MERKFRRIADCDISWLGGVCAGIAYFIGVPVWIVRIIYVGLMFLVGFPVIVYIILWMFVPKWKEIPKDFEEITGD